MQQYFYLQFKITNRKLKEFGLPPMLGYILLFIGFLSLSNYLFTVTNYAPYILTIIGIGILTKLTDSERNEFLKSCFSRKRYYILRHLENSLVILPIALVLLYQGSLNIIPILVASILIFSIINLDTNLNFSFPTPFYKRPFEFTIGFRNTFYLYPIAYTLTGISIYVGNFNLGIFSMLLIILIILSYYSKLENEYYIWSYNLAPMKFLRNKITIALSYTTLSVIPIIIALGTTFYLQVETLLLFLLLGYCYLSVLILAKYSVYPREMSIPQGILLTVGVLFPPALIGIAPYFYNQSRKRLKAVLK